MQEKIGSTRKLRNVIAAALAFVCLAALLPGRAQAAPELSARSAVLLDCATGRVLYEKDAGARRLIASTTKIMTGLLITERCPLDEAVTIPAAACGMEGSSLYLKPGEVLTVEQLLYGLLLQSGNDAAVALALHCSGSVPAFVAEMNRRAAALGLRDTHFANPNGLDDDGNYATARDLAYLAAYAMKQPAFARIAATKTASIPGRSLRNHNKLLWRYDGADGVKTGYTKAAGRILVSSAVRGGRRLVAVTINAPDDWRDHEKLLDDAFGKFAEKALLTEGQMVCELPVAGGAQTYCDLLAAETCTFPVAESERVSFRILAPDFLYAPVKAGQIVATAEVLLDGYPVASCPLRAKEEIKIAQKERRSFWQKLWNG